MSLWFITYYVRLVPSNACLCAIFSILRTHFESSELWHSNSSYTLEVFWKRVGMGRDNDSGQALWLDALFLPVVAQLNSRTVKDATEGDRLDLPVRHGVTEQTDARIHGLLGVVAGRAEVICSHTGDLVGMKIDHLKKEEEVVYQSNLKKRTLTSMFDLVLENTFLLKLDTHLDVLVLCKTSRYTG